MSKKIPRRFYLKERGSSRTKRPTFYKGRRLILEEQNLELVKEGVSSLAPLASNLNEKNLEKTVKKPQAINDGTLNATPVTFNDIKATNAKVAPSKITPIHFKYLKNHYIFKHYGRVFREICGWAILISVIFGYPQSTFYFILIWLTLWILTFGNFIDRY